MEINITEFFTNADPFEFSASRAERGQNAGPETWANAKAYRPPLLNTEDELQALRDYVKDFGAWSKDEIAAWSDNDCNALFIQLVSGDMREGRLDSDPDDSNWRDYEKGASDGRWSGNLFKTDDGKVYYSLSR